jgi:hypothetical protein
MPNFRQGPTDLSRRDPGQKWMLMTDPLWWEVAKRYAAELEKQNPGDPKLPALRLLAKDHRLSNDEAAYRALGRRYFYDAWQLPAAFAGCEGKDVVLTFKDQQGQARSWRGDWRANVDFAGK